MTHPPGQPMQCDAVEARLLDLVYGELDAEDAGSVRAHARGCESCGRSLAKLEGGRAVARKMDLAEPPAAAMSAVLAAARAQAGESQRAAARARIAEAERERRPSERPRARRDREAREGSAGRSAAGGWLADVLRKLGSIATGPQVAMALLLMLMVGIGLWSAPRMTGRDHPGATAVLEPDPDGEVGPSAGALTPAEPLRLEVDPHTDRIVEAEEDDGVAPPGERAGERVAVRGPTAETRGRTTPGATDSEGSGSERVVAERVVAEPIDERATELDRARDELAALETELAPGEGVGGGVQAGELPEPTGAGSQAVASVERSTPVPSVAPSHPAAAAAQTRATEPRATEPRAAETRAAETRAAEAQASAPRSPVARSVPSPTSPEAVPAPSIDTTEALAAGLHQQAREAGQAGRYAQCVSTAQQVLSRYPAYAQTGRVLLEMAECQRRLGQITVAERTLERAQRVAAVRPEAERRLATLRAERAAMDRAAAAEEGRGAERSAPEPASSY